jgi:hypothetical protein
VNLFKEIEKAREKHGEKDMGNVKISIINGTLGDLLDLTENSLGEGIINVLEHSDSWTIKGRDWYTGRVFYVVLKKGENHVES